MSFEEGKFRNSEMTVPILNYKGFTLTDQFHTHASSNLSVLATSDTLLAEMDG